MTGYIYKYENQVNHKVYIGQTIDLAARKASHISKARTVKNNKFYNAVRKYGWDSFDYSVIAQVEAEDIKELSSLLDSLEEQYVEQYDSYENGYNSTLGGHSKRGYHMSEKFREYCRQRTYSEETRKKFSKARENFVYTEEHRQKLRKAALERNFAAYRELTTEKRNAGIRKAKAKPVLQIDKDGKIVNRFEAIQDAALFIIANYAPDRALMGIWKGLYRHFNKETKKRFYYGFEWKLEAHV